MLVRIEPLELNASQLPNQILYGKIVEINMRGHNERTIIHAALDHCISWCIAEGARIENAQELLVWLHKNCSMRSA